MAQSCLFHPEQKNKQPKKQTSIINLCCVQFRPNVFSFLLFVPVFSFRGSEYLHVLFCSFFCLCVLSQTSPPFPSSPSHHTLASSLPTASVYLTLFLSLLLVPLLAAVATLCQQFPRRLGKEGAMI